MSRRDAGDETLLPKLPAGREWTPVRHGESGDRVYRRSDGSAYAKIASGKAMLCSRRARSVSRGGAVPPGSPSVCDGSQQRMKHASSSARCRAWPASQLPVVDLKRAWPSIGAAIEAAAWTANGILPLRAATRVDVDRAADVVRRDAVNPDFLAPGGSEHSAGRTARRSAALNCRGT